MEKNSEYTEKLIKITDDLLKASEDRRVTGPRMNKLLSKLNELTSEFESYEDSIKPDVEKGISLNFDESIESEAFFSFEEKVLQLGGASKVQRKVLRKKIELVMEARKKSSESFTSYNDLKITQSEISLNLTEDINTLSTALNSAKESEREAANKKVKKNFKKYAYFAGGLATVAANSLLAPTLTAALPIAGAFFGAASSYVGCEIMNNSKSS